MNRDQLETERNVLMNSFGLGPFRDGQARDRIAEIDRALAEDCCEGCGANIGRDADACSQCG